LPRVVTSVAGAFTTNAGAAFVDSKRTAEKACGHTQRQ
jgi:hypothetical protein